MLFRALSVVFIVLSVTSAFLHVDSAEYVPVFMWGATAGSAHKTRALEKLKADDFKDVLLEQLDSNPFTVVFIEETLSVEDFSSRDSEGRTPYPGLREKMTGESVIYFPYVASALHALNKLADPNKVNRVQLTDEGLSAYITPGAGQCLYISLKDARDGEDRMHMLSRHDQFMTEMFDKLLKSHDNVLAIYTSRFPSWEIPSAPSRSRRSLLEIANWEAAATPENGFYNFDNKIYLFASSISLMEANNNYTLKKGVITPPTAGDNMTAALTFSTDGTEANNVVMTFSYYKNNGYWYMDVGLSDKAEDKKTAVVFAPYDFSYHCSPFLSFTTDSKKTVIFNDLQTQPFFTETKADGSPVFNLAYDCVGFTSVPIWSGLFISFLVIFITAMGILFMMDIRTMDRFDDPKGKTITITASE